MRKKLRLSHNCPILNSRSSCKENYKTLHLVGSLPAPDQVWTQLALNLCLSPPEFGKIKTKQNTSTWQRCTHKPGSGSCKDSKPGSGSCKDSVSQTLVGKSDFQAIPGESALTSIIQLAIVRAKETWIWCKWRAEWAHLRVARVQH